MNRDPQHDSRRACGAAAWTLILAMAMSAQAGELVVAPRGSPRMCQEYAAAINTRRVVPPDTPLACDRGLWEDPVFSPGAKRVLIPPEDMARVLLEAAAMQHSNDRADMWSQLNDNVPPQLKKPESARLIAEMGLAFRQAYRFDPWIDIDNDGVAEDVALVGYYGMPCGTQTQNAQEITKVSLVVLRPSGGVDIERTLKIYEPGRWARWEIHSSAVNAGLKPPPLEFRWSDMFSVFRYQDAVHFDRRGIRYPESRRTQVIYAVFKATPAGVEKICELSVQPTKDP